MKHSIYLWIAAVLITLAMIACEKDYVAPANSDFSDAAVSRSGTQTLERGDTTSFVDLSRGILNRTWTLPAGSRIINLNGKDPSELDVVHIQFDEPGLLDVGLKVEFEDSNLNFDTLFPVTVYDFITTEIDVVSIEAGFFEETPNQITMYEGGVITYADSSAGNPNRRLWKFPGASPEEAGGISIDDDKTVSTISATYPEIGVYDVQLITWRQFPQGDPDTVLLRDYVNVIKNVDPPSLLSIDETKEGTLLLTYNLSMKITGDITSNFTLMVDDTLTAINSVAVSADNDRVIEIIPAVNIDHVSSSARLTYDGNGGLSRTNDVEAPAFSDTDIVLFQPFNILAASGADPSFESGSLAGWQPDIQASNASAVNNGASYELANIGHNGSSHSMLVNLNANADLADGEKNNFRVWTNNSNAPIEFEVGRQYRIEFWYKVEAPSGVGEFTWRFHGAGWPPAIGGGWTGGGLTDTGDGWRFRRITWNQANPDPLSDGRLSVQFISKNNVASKVYLDDITVYALD